MTKWKKWKSGKVSVKFKVASGKVEPAEVPLSTYFPLFPFEV
jgi:hypothetical protein